MRIDLLLFFKYCCEPTSVSHHTSSRSTRGLPNIARQFPDDRRKSPKIGHVRVPHEGIPLTLRPALGHTHRTPGQEHFQGEHVYNNWRCEQGHPSPDGLFVLDTDSSGNQIGAELSQVQNGVIRPICYASHVLMKQHRNYCTTRKELLAIVKFCRQFRHYLLGRFFLIRTDHNSLVWLTRFKYIEGQLARWIEELSQYNF